ncbi:hypothetical protein N7490_001736 [Penicillium lividum]|nr:hypothetical protein N7490_001736 [Penicillium lividum]
MKFILILLCVLLALVAADAVNDQCAKLCNASDACCIAKCFKVPCPDATQVEESNKCAAACPQGNGSSGDTQKYADCQKNCFDRYYIGTDGVTPATVPVDTSSSGTTSSGTTSSGTTVSGTTASGTTMIVPGFTVFGTTVHDTTVPGTTVTGGHTTQTDAIAQSGSKAASTADGSAISGSSSTHANATATHASNAVANVNMGALSVRIFGLVLAALAL